MGVVNVVQINSNNRMILLTVIPLTVNIRRVWLSLPWWAFRRTSRRCSCPSWGRPLEAETPRSGCTWRWTCQTGGTCSGPWWKSYTKL